MRAAAGGGDDLRVVPGLNRIAMDQAPGAAKFIDTQSQP
jgi:hypothetical protein